MTVSKSALKKAKTPIQRKRLLSVAAAIDDEDSVRVRNLGRRGWREDGGETESDGEEDVEMKRLDSETGQTILSKEPGVC